MESQISNNLNTDQLIINLSNFRCFETREQVINKGLILLFGQRGTGKSTIMESICYVLYGKLKGFKTFGKTKCTVKITINNIMIVRENSKRVKLIKNNIIYEAEAQDMINEEFGDYETFVMSSYLKQKLQTQFLSLSNSKKLEYLRRFSMGNFNVLKFREKLNKEINIFSSKLNIVENTLKINNENLDNFLIIRPDIHNYKYTKIKKSEYTIKEIKDNIDISRKIFEIIEEEKKYKFPDHENFINFIKEIQLSINKSEKLNNINEQLNNFNPEKFKNIDFNKLNNNIKELNKQYNYNEKYKNFDINNANKRLLNYKKAHEIYTEYKYYQKKRKTSFDEDILINKINNLKSRREVIHSGECPCCNDVLSLVKTNNKIEFQKGKITTSGKVKDNNNNLIKKYEDDLEIILCMKKFNTIPTSKQHKILTLTSMINNYDENKIANLNIIKQSLDKQRKQYNNLFQKKTIYDNLMRRKNNIKINKIYLLDKKQLENLKKIKELNKKLNNLFNKKTIDKSIEELNTILDEEINKKQIELKNKDIEYINNIKNNIKQYNNQFKLYQKRLNTLQFLKLSLIQAEHESLQNVLSNINYRMKEYLDELFDDPINVELKTIKETGVSQYKFNIKIIYKNNKYSSIDQMSDGERDSISLALTLAFNETYNSKILMLDETLNSLDLYNMNKALHLLSTFEDKYIIISSHHIIKGLFDQILKF